MARRQKEWARRTRDGLLAALGRQCAWCGTTANLQFDCIIPQGDHHHKIDWSHRMSFYRQQHTEGNLQILCERCNSIKGDEMPESVSQLVLGGVES